MGGACTTLPAEGGNSTVPNTTTPLQSCDSSNTRPKNIIADRSRPSSRKVGEPKQEIDLYEKILSSNGALPIPEKFAHWFPPRHGHKKVRKLFKWGVELGQGVTGSVYEVEYKGQICAIKQVEKNDQWGKMLFTTEARVLSKLKHNGIIQFIDMFFDERYYYLVVEKADYDLYYVMKEKGSLSERKTKNITYSLLKAIAYMHKKNLAHRDLKPENIVFVANETNKPRLIDFGDAEMAKKDKTYTEFVGTPPYMSPERLDEHKGWQLKKADVWAIAVIAYEMYCGKRCFEGDTQKQVFGKILRGEWSWPSDKRPSNKFQDFVQQCLQHDAKDRPTAKEAINHPWFDSKRKEETPAAAAAAVVAGDAMTAVSVDDNSSSPHQYVQKIKPESHNGVIKVKDITDHNKREGLTQIFENLASMVTSNRLQDILVKGYTENLQGDDLGPYQEDFDKLDQDKDGFISGHDLMITFTSQGIGPNQAASLASIIIGELDYNRTGKVTFRQFLEARIKSELSNRPRDIFNMISSQGNISVVSPQDSSPFLNSTIKNQINRDFEASTTALGYASSAVCSEDEHDDVANDLFITPQDIQKYATASHASIHLSEQDLREIFETYDKDKDGRLTFSDFVQAMYATRVVDAPVIDDKLHELPRNKRCHSKTDIWKNQSRNLPPPNDDNNCKLSLQHSL